VATTRNGWTQAPKARTAIGAPGCADTGEVRAGDVAVVMQALANAFDAEVEPLVTINGYRSPAYNAQVGGDASSNHLSGTALDFNGARHPYERNLPASRRGKAYDHGFTDAQVKAIRALLKRFGGVVGWGLDFNTGYRDAMHFEIRGSADDVARLAASLASGQTAANTEPPEEEDDMSAGVVLIEQHRGYWLVGPGYARQMHKEWEGARADGTKAGGIDRLVRAGIVPVMDFKTDWEAFDNVFAAYTDNQRPQLAPAALAAAIAKALPAATGGPSVDQIAAAVRAVIDGARITPA
jgi:hypothetical protein